MAVISLICSSIKRAAGGLCVCPEIRMGLQYQFREVTNHIELHEAKLLYNLEYTVILYNLEYTVIPNVIFFSISFYLFIYLFTILYWFCHTLTWLCHGCTCVPHPEPPSHLPPHPIPLGHPTEGWGEGFRKRSVMISFVLRLLADREGNGNPLQFSCLENSMDSGAGQATVHGITKSWARLSY